MKITKSQLRKLIKEEMLKEVEEMSPELSPEFADSFQILGLAIRAKREVEDARVSGDVNLDKLEVMLQELIDRLPDALK